MWQIESVKVNRKKENNEYDVIGGRRGDGHCALKLQNDKLKPLEKG